MTPRLSLVTSVLSLGLIVGGLFMLATSRSPSPVGSVLSALFGQSSPSPITQTTRILFGGDVMFDRYIRQKMNQHGQDYILESLQTTFEQYDLVVANLEGPITTSPSRSIYSEIGSPSNYIFTFDPSITSILQKSRLTVLNLGNNHILNFGTEGARQTKEILRQHQLDYFGDTRTETNSSERVLIKRINGLTIGFVNYNQFVDEGYEHALEDLTFARSRAQIVIVYAHWGLEYQPTANKVITDQAHQFIDAGADLIIGSHPHVVQQQEDYQGKRIYYSLGNFVFDQYFSRDTQRGLLVGVEITPELTFHYQEMPIVLKSTGQTILAVPAEKQNDVN